MSSSVETSLILQALLWDVPRLQLTGSPGARLFLSVLNFRVSPAALETAPDDPLGQAGVALAEELSGRREEAHAIYEQLAASRGEAGLLGIFLLAWSSTEDDPAVLQRALAVMEELPDPELRARLCCKLIAAALSHHWDSDLEGLFQLALGWAPAGGELSYALRIEAHNLGVSAPPADSRYDGDPDPLVRYDWITGLADDAVSKRLMDQVLSQAQSPWAVSFTIGRTETDSSVAAYVQAEWAGALWWLRDLRKKLAAQVLLDSSARPRQLADAVVSWALGGGRSIEAIADLAEPGFDENSADEIIAEVDRGGPLRQQYVWQVSELMVALWDLISVDRAIELLNRFPLHSADPLISRRAATFWSLMSLRVPDWESRFVALDAAERAGLLNGLTAAVIARLSPAAVDAILTSKVSAPDLQSASWALVAHRGGRDELTQLDGVSATVIAQLAPDAPELVAPQLDRAIEELLEQTRRDVDQARAGSQGFGGPDSFTLLARAAITRGSDSLKRAAAALIDVSIAEDLPADIRFQALRGLTLIAHHRGVDEEAVETLARAPLAGSGALLTPTSPALMEVARLTLLAAAGRQLPMEGLVLIRDEQAQVRDLAVEACSLMVRNQGSEILEATLASALFDPDRAIAVHALRHFAAVPPRSRAVRPAVARRVLALFQRGGRGIRAAAVQAVAAGVLGEDQEGESSQVLATARRDRSFLVRDAAEPSTRQ